MSSQTSSTLNRNASQIPREYSSQIQSHADWEKARRQSRRNVVVVGVPDLGDAEVPAPHHLERATASETKDLPEVVFASTAGAVADENTTDTQDQASQHQPAAELSVDPPTETDEKSSSKSAQLDAIAMSLREMFTQQDDELASQRVVEATNRTKAEQSDEDWQQDNAARKDRGTEPKPPEKDVVDLPAGTEIDQEAVKKLTEQIIRKFDGVGSSAIIGFAGTEKNESSTEMCAAIAAELASRGLGHVLLIDGDFEEGALSCHARKSTVNGLRNLMMRSSLDLNELVLRSVGRPLDFLPSGNIKVKYWLKASDRLQDILARVRPVYRFVCVALGDAHEKATKVISSSCDGVYLFVSMTETSRVVAESASRQFYESGATVIGCVVSDLPSAA